MNNNVAKILGRLAEHVVRLKPRFVMQRDLDAIVVALRLGEGRVLKLESELAIAKAEGR